MFERKPSIESLEFNNFVIQWLLLNDSEANDSTINITLSIAK